MENDDSKKVKTKAMECLYCGKPFLAFTNLLTKIDDQPCPYCLMSKSGKYVKNENNKNK